MLELLRNRPDFAFVEGLYQVQYLLVAGVLALLPLLPGELPQAVREHLEVAGLGLDLGLEVHLRHFPLGGGTRLFLPVQADEASEVLGLRALLDFGMRRMLAPVDFLGGDFLGDAVQVDGVLEVGVVFLGEVEVRVVGAAGLESLLGFHVI